MPVSLPDSISPRASRYRDLDAARALLLGEALYELGDFAAAEQVLARGQQLPGSEHVALRLAVTRAKNAQWGQCQPQTALSINAAARAVVVSGSLREELVADEASVLAFSGQPDRALAVLERISGGDARTRVVRAIAAAPALAVAPPGPVGPAPWRMRCSAMPTPPPGRWPSATPDPRSGSVDPSSNSRRLDRPRVSWARSSGEADCGRLLGRARCCADPAVTLALCGS